MIKFKDTDIVGCDINSDRVFVDVDIYGIYDIDVSVRFTRAEIVQICKKMNVTVSELLGDSPK